MIVRWFVQKGYSELDVQRSVRVTRTWSVIVSPDSVPVQPDCSGRNARRNVTMDFSGKTVVKSIQKNILFYIISYLLSTIILNTTYWYSGFLTHQVIIFFHFYLQMYMSKWRYLWCCQRSLYMLGWVVWGELSHSLSSWFLWPRMFAQLWYQTNWDSQEVWPAKRNTNMYCRISWCPLPIWVWSLLVRWRMYFTVYLYQREHTEVWPTKRTLYLSAGFSWTKVCNIIVLIRKLNFFVHVWQWIFKFK